MRPANQQWNLRKIACIALLAALHFASLPYAHAQNTSSQFWPEIDAYWTFNPKVQLEMMTSRSTDGVGYSSAELGPTLKISLKPFFRKRLITPDQTLSKFLVFEIGYRYLTGVSQPDENRVQLALTPQFPLPWGMVLADRNQIDLRSIEYNGFSWRYRNRATIQRSFKVGRIAFSPYARGEVFYSSIPGAWNKTTYSFGAFIPLWKRFELQPYYEHDNNLNAMPQYVNATGLTFSVYLHNPQPN